MTESVAGLSTLESRRTQIIRESDAGRVVTIHFARRDSGSPMT
jgi:hypothetical protein